MPSRYADMVIQQLLQPRGGTTPGQAINSGTAQIAAALMARSQEQKQKAAQQAAMQSLINNLQGQPQGPLPASPEGPTPLPPGTPRGEPNYRAALAAALAGVQDAPQVGGIVPFLAGRAFPQAEAESPFDKISPKDFTPESLAAFSRSRNFADLQRADGGPSPFTTFVDPLDQKNQRTVRRDSKDADFLADSGWVERQGTGTTVNIGETKPPTGYLWKDPENPRAGVTPIKGGPEDRLSPDQAAKVASMAIAKTDFATVQSILLDEKGNLKGGVELYTGVIPATEGNRLKKSMRRTVEAVLRARTGAAAPETEVNNYVDMFMPSALDNDPAKLDKLNALREFIQTTETLVSEGASAATGGFSRTVTLDGKTYGQRGDQWFEINGK